MTKTTKMKTKKTMNFEKLQRYQKNMVETMKRMSSVMRCCPFLHLSILFLCSLDMETEMVQVLLGAVVEEAGKRIANTEDLSVAVAEEEEL